MKTLFIAFFVGICCLLSACDIWTGSNQEPIVINWAETVELPEEVYVGNIEKDTEAIQVEPRAKIYRNLGASYLEQGKVDEAIVAFKKAVQIAPSCVEVHYLLADVYSIKGEGVLSRKSLDQAMALEGSYIIDIRSGIMDRTRTIIESIPPTVIKSEEIIELPPEFFKGDVPRR